METLNMFGFIFIAAAVIPFISSRDLLDFDRNIGFQHAFIKSDKENHIEFHVIDEVAALKEMVLKQVQEMYGLKQLQNIQKQEIGGLQQEIGGLKREIGLINKKTREQDVLIDFQVKFITKLENIVKNQDKKISDMLFVISEQKESMERIKPSEIEQNSPNFTKKDDTEDRNDLKKVARTNNVSSKVYNVLNENSKTKGQNSLRKTLSTTFERNSRLTTIANIAFSAYLNHNLENLTTGFVIKCNQALLNVGNAYNTFTGVFTVPRTGVYLLTFTINTQLHIDISSTGVFVKLVSNNRNIIDAVAFVRDKYRDQMGGNTAIVQLNEGESVWLENMKNSGRLQTDGNYRYVSFSGVFLF